ncbi:hypothetical protein EAI_09305, partial [Harpegnathos saltator]
MSCDTIRRCIRAYNEKYRSKVKKLPLSEKHVEKRIAWA